MLHWLPPAEPEGLSLPLGSHPACRYHWLDRCLRVETHSCGKSRRAQKQVPQPVSKFHDEILLLLLSDLGSQPRTEQWLWTVHERQRTCRTVAIAVLSTLSEFLVSARSRKQTPRTAATPSYRAVMLRSCSTPATCSALWHCRTAYLILCKLSGLHQSQRRLQHLQLDSFFVHPLYLK